MYWPLLYMRGTYLNEPSGRQKARKTYMLMTHEVKKYYKHNLKLSSIKVSFLK